jgi:hypothetical protein
MTRRVLARRHGPALLFAIAVGSVGCTRVGKPPWWPKATPVEAARCREPVTEADEMQHLQLIAEVDMDDDHVQQTVLLNPRNPKATPWTPELARMGDCYSQAKDLEPEAKGAVVVRYAVTDGNVSKTCLAHTAIQDGELVECVLRGVRSLPASWLDYDGVSGIVSVEFIPETEAAYSYWYGTGEMRWWGRQAPRMKDVPKSD